MPGESRPTNASLLVPYALPLFVYVGVGSLPPGLGLSREALYLLRLVATAALLAALWRRYVPLRGPASLAGSVGLGALAGIAGTALWVALKAPFYPEGGDAWSPQSFALRVVASGTVVPLFEELLFRGYVLRLLVQWERARRAGIPHAWSHTLERSSVGEVEPRAWTPLAVSLSTLAFAAGHQPGEYSAAIAYGLLMAALWVRRGDLVACVVAHGVTNVALAAYVAWSGSWSLW